jgi:hypothetical protein
MSKYVDSGYGKDGSIAISRDAELLVSLGFNASQIEKDFAAMFESFVAAGGDDSHSDYSWSCVRSLAMVLLNNNVKLVDELPTTIPQSDRVLSE